ncbi:MAG: ankyrin repeat domain-containing protein, partial [Thomasclavelia spiroformis]
MKKGWMIFILSLIISCITGCNKQTDTAKEQLYASICRPNIQGVKEALTNDKKISNKNIKRHRKLKPLDLSLREIENERIQLQICSMLIKAGADVNEIGEDKLSHLCWAIENDRYKIAEELIKAEADVNQKSDEGDSPIRAALSKLSPNNYTKRKKIIAQLSNHGVKMDRELFTYFYQHNDYGMNYYFAPEILKLMQKNKVDPNIPKEVLYAVKGDDKKVQKYLKENKSKKHLNKNSFLAFAVAYCNVDTLSIMKEVGYDFSWKDKDGVNCLQIAALCNDSNVVKYLLQEGLDGNGRTDYYKADAISFAVLGGQLENARLLKEDGNVNYEKNKEDGEVVSWQFITAFGNQKSFATMNELGYVPTDIELYHAYEQVNDETFRYLLDHHYSIKVKEEGDNLLDSVCLNSTYKAQELCKRGLKASEENLKTLIWIGGSDLAKEIMEDGMTQGKIRKNVLLQESINIGDFSMVRYLVKNGAEINKYVKDET